MLGYENRYYHYDLNGILDRTMTHLSTPDSRDEYRYYLYNDAGNLLGYLPNEPDDPSKKAHFIFDEQKSNALRTIGTKNFIKKYSNGQNLMSIVEDCYEQFHNVDLLINGKPVSQFLERIKKPNVKYLVFEIADNYFLFYKLID